MRFIINLTGALMMVSMAFSACNNNKAIDADTNQKFEKFTKRFIEKLWEINPVWASGVGYHKYDSKLPIPGEENRQIQQLFASNYLDSISRFDVERLDDAHRIDLLMLKNMLEESLWNLNEFRDFEWNPSNFNIAGALSAILHEQYAPLDERLKSLYEKISHVPAYYRGAKKNIIHPTKIHTQLSIDQNEGSLTILQNDLADSVINSGLNDSLKKVFSIRIDSASMAVQDYIDWLRDTILPGLDDLGRDFRIGQALYTAKFKFEMISHYSAEQIYQKSLRARDSVQQEMIKLTESIWDNYFDVSPDVFDLKSVKTMLNTLSANHVPADSFEKSITTLLPKLSQFVSDHNLLWMDPQKPLKVRQTPAYMRGISIASCSSPGPYDKNGNTYYNVDPMNDFGREQTESLLREYNRWMMQILSIHEAIPGHYAQLVYANESPSLIKSLFGNNTMIEGWACYAERFMLENGYGKHQAEMMLMYNKWLLRIICNTILDYGVHVKAMSKEEAMDLLINQAFQEPSEAEGKWRRVSVSQVQLDSYFTGLTEILALREAWKKQEGNNYSLKVFNEKFLSYGSAPVKYIRELMLTKE